MTTENQTYIPEDWILTNFGDKKLFEILGSGITFFEKEKDYYSTSSIEVDKLIEVEQVISYRNRPSRANMQPVPNSVWFAKMKNTLKVIQPDQYQIDNVIFSTGFCGIKANNIDCSYLFQVLKSEDFNTKKDNLAEGTTQVAVNNQHVRNIEFLLPCSILEQQKIASILSKIDEAITQTEQLIEKYNKIKEGLMHDLLTKGIGNEDFELISTDLKNIEVKCNFYITTLKAITKVRQGYQIEISSRKKEEGENRFVYITVQYINNPKKYLEYIENPPLEVISKYDDILFTRTGNTGQIVTNIVGVYHNNFFKVDFDRKLISKDYLLLFLQWEPVKGLILELAGTTTIPDLKHKDFYSIPIFFPKTLEEQNAITTSINKINEVVERYETELSKLESLKSGLMHDLLTGKVRVQI